jgi:hypothetical protein
MPAMHRLSLDLVTLTWSPAFCVLLPADCWS